MGTPDFAEPTLRALAARHQVAAAYTQPPRPAGRRGRELTPSPVQRAAQELGITVRDPTSLKGAAEQAAFAALSADIAVVAAYGLILPQAVLDAPRHGCLNIHASLLPRWRGAAPVQRAMLAGDAETGVTIMAMAAGLDTGPMLASRATPIAMDDNAGTLTARLAEMGATLLLEVLADLPAYPPVAQPNDGVTYAAKLAKAEAQLDFTADAAQVHRQIAAFNPPGAWFEHGGERARVLSAEMAEGDGPPGVVIDNRLAIACGTGAIRAVRLQRAGRPAMTATEMLRGWAIPPGTLLSPLQGRDTQARQPAA